MRNLVFDERVSGFGFGVSGFVIWVSGHGHQRLRLQAYKGHKSGNATFCAGVGVVRVQGPRNPIRQRQPIHTDVAHATLSAYLCDSHLQVRYTRIRIPAEASVFVSSVPLRVCVCVHVCASCLHFSVCHDRPFFYSYVCDHLDAVICRLLHLFGRDVCARSMQLSAEMQAHAL